MTLPEIFFFESIYIYESTLKDPLDFLFYFFTTLILYWLGTFNYVSDDKLPIFDMLGNLNSNPSGKLAITAVLFLTLS